MTGFVASSVPSVRPAETVAPSSILSVPSESVVASVREEPRVSVPAPVFSSAPEVGAEMVAETEEATETEGTVSVEEPAIVAEALKASDAADASAASVAVAPAVLKMALL